MLAFLFGPNKPNPDLTETLNELKADIQRLEEDNLKMRRGYDLLRAKHNRLKHYLNKKRRINKF